MEQDADEGVREVLRIWEVETFRGCERYCLLLQADTGVENGDSDFFFFYIALMYDAIETLLVSWQTSNHSVSRFDLLRWSGLGFPGPILVSSH